MCLAALRLMVGDNIKAEIFVTPGQFTIVPANRHVAGKRQADKRSCGFQSQRFAFKFGKQPGALAGALSGRFDK